MLVSEQGKAFLGSQESPGLPPGEWPNEMVKGPERRSVLMARNPTHLGSIQCLYLGLTFEGQAGPSSSSCLLPFFPVSVISLGTYDQNKSWTRTSTSKEPYQGDRAVARPTTNFSKVGPSRICPQSKSARKEIPELSPSGCEAS